MREAVTKKDASGRKWARPGSLIAAAIVNAVTFFGPIEYGRASTAFDDKRTETSNTDLREKNRPTVPNPILVAQSGSKADRCQSSWSMSKKEEAETNISACTRDIESGQFNGRDLADKFIKRGDSYARLQDSLPLNKRNFEPAISDYSKSIDAFPKAEAYISRGEVFSKLGTERDQLNAIADFGGALKYDTYPPMRKAILFKRGAANMRVGNLDAAIADLDAAENREDSLNSWLEYRLVRGQINYYLGRPSEARKDFNDYKTYTFAHPSIAPAWLEILDRREGQPSRLVEMSRNEGCSGNFYGAQRLLLNGQTSAAIAKFRSAETECPASRIEHVAARLELKKLNANR